MTRVLLFGAGGFIGGHVRAALAAEPRITTVTSVRRERCDLVTASQEALSDLVMEEAPDTIVNCTGRLTGTGYELVLANTAVTAKLIEAVRRGAPGARLVRLGSAAEYGAVPHGVSVSEDHPAVPASEYGASHLAATHLMRLARIDGIVLRVFNPIGAGLHEDNMLGRCAALLRRASADGARSITLGSLAAYRDFVDVRDVAAAVLAAVVAPQVTARVCNVASGQAVPAREVVRLLVEAAGFTGEVVERGAGPVRSAGVGWMRGDIDLARRTLGWAPSYELADAVKAIWSTDGS
jgi:nucleoside-diphosphate-sugar epimerase